MYFSDQITLRTVTTTTDEEGFSVPSVAEKTVWADKHSITRNEYFAAASASMRVDVGFTVHVEDYDGQTEVEYDGVVYSVIRAYQTGEGTVDLTCAKR